MKLVTQILLGMASALTVEDPYNPFDRKVAYNASLPCSSCVTSGYNFCWKPKERKEFEPQDSNNLVPFLMQIGAKCCKDNTCAEEKQQGYVCSSFYRSPEYALAACPSIKRKCGSINDFDVDKGNWKLSLGDLELGDTCTYKLRSKCKAPIFKVDGVVNSDDSVLKIQYLEWEVKRIKGGKRCRQHRRWNLRRLLQLGRKQLRRWKKNARKAQRMQQKAAKAVEQSNTKANQKALLRANRVVRRVSSKTTRWTERVQKRQERLTNHKENVAEWKETRWPNRPTRKNRNRNGPTVGQRRSKKSKSASKSHSHKGHNHTGSKSASKSSSGGSASETQRKCLPNQDLATRDQWFHWAGKNNKTQWLAPYKKKNGRWMRVRKIIRTQSTSGADEIEEGETAAGYGQPSGGEYDPAAGGNHVFGTIGQGNGTTGATMPGTKKCRQRRMLVTVIAVPKDIVVCLGTDCPCIGPNCTEPCNGTDCPCVGPNCTEPCNGTDCPCVGPNCTEPCNGTDCPCVGPNCTDPEPCTGTDCPCVGPNCTDPAPCTNPFGCDNTTNPEPCTNIFGCDDDDDDTPEPCTNPFGCDNTTDPEPCTGLFCESSSNDEPVNEDDEDDEIADVIGEDDKEDFPEDDDEDKDDDADTTTPEPVEEETDDEITVIDERVDDQAPSPGVKDPVPVVVKPVDQGPLTDDASNPFFTPSVIFQGGDSSIQSGDNALCTNPFGCTNTTAPADGNDFGGFSFIAMPESHSPRVQASRPATPRNGMVIIFGGSNDIYGAEAEDEKIESMMPSVPKNSDGAAYLSAVLAGLIGIATLSI